MSWLLDTNACIGILNRTTDSIAERVTEAGPTRLAVSTVTVAELEFGVAHSEQVRANAVRLSSFLAEIQAVPFTKDCAERFGQLKAELRTVGKPLSDFDLAIAATALTLGRTLVTSDRAFARINSLSVENWLAR